MALKVTKKSVNNFYEDLKKSSEKYFSTSHASEEHNTVTSEIHHPFHYTQGGIEVIDILKAKLTAKEFQGYLRASLLAYIFRAPHKENEIKDYKKAQWYLNRLIDELIKSEESLCRKS